MLDDLYRFTYVCDPQLSPDKSKVAFHVGRAVREADDYEYSIWIIGCKDEELIAQTSGPRDLWCRWAPNGRDILFLSRRTLKKDEKGSELWVMRIDGGEARIVLKRSEGIEKPMWHPNCRHVLFISNVRGDGEGDVRVIRRIPIWTNGAGFTYNLRKHIFEVDTYTSNVRQITSGEFDVLYAVYSNSGDKIAFVARTNDLKPYITDIFILPRNGSEAVKITNSDMIIGPIAWSPNDKYIAFIGRTLHRGFSGHETLWAVSVDGGKLENLTAKMDRGCGRRIYYDMRGPYVVEPEPVWSRDYIYFPISDAGRYNIYRIHFNRREIEPVIKGDFMVLNFTVKDDVIAFTRTSEIEPAEVWVKDEYGIRKLTHFNDDLVRKLNIVKPEKFSFKASDGFEIDGWIIRPVNFKSGEKYPAILQIHGGPKSAFGYSFMFEFQLLASNGYVVIYANPRGSDGYSEEFADLRGKYGEDDYRELMELIDYVIENYEFVDSNRMGVTGLSYGGFMTNWIVTQTNRFRAAVSLEGISSWIAEYGTTDIGFYFVPDQLKASPWENWKVHIEKSPLRYADKVETPILFIHSMEDYRCWIDQALLFYTALKSLGKETELVLFMKGDHVFCWSGKPSLRIERLKHTLRWFDKYLKRK